jgi:hypothetical protein
MKKKPVVLLTALLLGCHELGEEQIRKIMRPQHFSGYVIKKFRDSTDKEEPKFLLNDYNVVFCYNQDMYDSVSLGDTIIKQADFMAFRVLRGRDTFIFYPQCRGVDVKDVK